MSSQLSKINPVSSSLCLLQHTDLFWSTQLFFSVSVLVIVNVWALSFTYSIEKLILNVTLCTYFHFGKRQHNVCIMYFVEWLLENRASLSSSQLIAYQRHLCPDLFLQCVSSQFCHVDSCGVCNCSSNPGLKMNESLIYDISCLCARERDGQRRRVDWDRSDGVPKRERG